MRVLDATQRDFINANNTAANAEADAKAAAVEVVVTDSLGSPTCAQSSLPRVPRSADCTATASDAERSQ